MLPLHLQSESHIPLYVQLRDQLRALATHLCSLQSVTLAPQDREVMVDEIMNEIYGFGPLEPLMHDPAISDVLVNGSQNVLGRPNIVADSVRSSGNAALIRKARNAENRRKASAAAAMRQTTRPGRPRGVACPSSTATIVASGAQVN